MKPKEKTKKNYKVHFLKNKYRMMKTKEKTSKKTMSTCVNFSNM
jgi:hypothetical protein